MDRSWLFQRWVIGIAAFAVPFAGLVPPAQGAPEDTSVMAFLLPCDGAVCDPETDARVPDDQVVSGEVQLQASSAATVGLSTVELQAQVDGTWRCLRRWETSARTFRAHLNLDTTSKLAGCTASFGQGENGVYRFRTLAEDRTGQSQASAAYLLRVNNAPATPRWADPPKGLYTTEGPRITIRWQANPEPDIVEYHFIRSGPTREVELAVSASRPSGQGCIFDSGVYQCTDDAFTASDEGTYRYTLIAYRGSPSSATRCALPGTGSCISSAASEPQSLTVSAPKAGDPPPPPPPPPPTARTGSSRGSSGGSTPSRPSGPTLSDLAAGEKFCFECGEFSPELPYDSPVIVDDRAPTDPALELPAGDEQLAAFDPALASALEAERARRGFIALAAGLLFLLLALQLGRVLRDPARQRG